MQSPHRQSDNQTSGLQTQTSRFVHGSPLKSTRDSNDADWQQPGRFVESKGPSDAPYHQPALDDDDDGFAHPAPFRYAGPRLGPSRYATFESNVPVARTGSPCQAPATHHPVGRVGPHTALGRGLGGLGASPSAPGPDGQGLGGTRRPLLSANAVRASKAGVLDVSDMFDQAAVMLREVMGEPWMSSVKTKQMQPPAFDKFSDSSYLCEDELNAQVTI